MRKASREPNEQREQSCSYLFLYHYLYNIKMAQGI